MCFVRRPVPCQGNHSDLGTKMAGSNLKLHILIYIWFSYVFVLVWYYIDIYKYIRSYIFLFSLLFLCKQKGGQADNDIFRIWFFCSVDELHDTHIFMYIYVFVSIRCMMEIVLRCYILHIYTYVNIKLTL